MKLRQLQCLCTVVDVGFNFSRAAAVLHATQPAVAKQLRLLEEELGVEVFVRQSNRPLGLTESGAHIEKWARQALQCVANIKNGASDGAAQTFEPIVLATSQAHAKYLLLPAIQKFNLKYPGVPLHVHQGLPEHVAEQLHQGKATFGITHLPPELPRDILAVPFLTTHRVVIAPRGHPLMSAGRITLEQLAAYPILLQQSTRPRGPRVIQTFQDAGIHVKPIVQSLDIDIVKSYVAAGLGVGVVPAFCYSEEKDGHLQALDVGHLFVPTVSAVLLRRNSFLQQHVYDLLQEVDPVLSRAHIEASVF